MYTVIEKFIDSDKANTPYKPGDPYPAKRKRTNEDRIEELLGKNRYKRPFIKEVPDQQED